MNHVFLRSPFLSIVIPADINIAHVLLLTSYATTALIINIGVSTQYWGCHVTTCKHVHAMITPLIPYFYMVKMGLTGVHLFFLCLIQDIDCGYSLESPRRQSTINVLSKKDYKYQTISDEIFNLYS